MNGWLVKLVGSMKQMTTFWEQLPPVRQGPGFTGWHRNHLIGFWMALPWWWGSKAKHRKLGGRFVEHNDHLRDRFAKKSWESPVAWLLGTSSSWPCATTGTGSAPSTMKWLRNCKRRQKFSVALNSSTTSRCDVFSWFLEGKSLATLRWGSFLGDPEQWSTWPWCCWDPEPGSAPAMEEILQRSSSALHGGRKHGEKGLSHPAASSQVKDSGRLSCQICQLVTEYCAVYQKNHQSSECAKFHSFWDPMIWPWIIPTVFHAFPGQWKPPP